MLDRLRAIEAAATAEVIAHGTACKRNPDEVLRMVREGVCPGAGRGAAAVGVHGEFHASPLLLDFVRYLETARDGAADRSGVTEAREAVRHAYLRGVRAHGGNGGAPCGRQPVEQLADQPANPLHLLSLVLARHAEAFGAAADAAAEIIGAYLDTHPENTLDILN